MNKKSMKEYRIWRAMKARCYAPSCKNVGLYQKLGIKVCDRWLHDFDAFLADMGRIPDDSYSIERIDNTKDYCPENCKWIPMREQSKNRLNVPLYTYNGETHNLKDWAEILNLNIDMLRGRISRGMKFEDAIIEDAYHRQIVIDGESKTVKEWCIHYGLNAGSVYSRIHRGKSPIDALTKKQEKIKLKEEEKK